MMWKLNLSGGQRLLLNLKNFDACPLLNNVDLIPPLLKPNFDYLNEIYPGMVHKCPYTASLDIFDAKDVSKTFFFQTVKCVNATIPKYKKNGEMKWQWYPSGSYKILYKASDDSDENIMTLILRNEIYHHLQDAEF
jgi:hypothetical protein